MTRSMSFQLSCLTVVLLVLFSVGAQAGVLGTYNIDPLPTGTVTLLPATNGNAIVNYLDSDFEQHSISNFTSLYRLEATNTWDALMLRWPDWGGRNLSSVDTFVLGVTGTAQQIKAEFEDVVGDKTVFYLRNIAPTMQYYHISGSLVSNIAGIKVVAFVSELSRVGPITNGSYTVFLGNLHYPNIGGAGSGTPTVLPNEPTVTTVGGANPDTVLVSTNASLIEVKYNVTGGGWSGCTILYDDYGTVPIESQDLSGYPNLTFGLYGAPAGLKIEVLDMSNKTMDVTCTGITAGVTYYTLDTTQFHVDAQHIRMINFVVDQGLAGAANYSNKFWVVSGGLNYDIQITPSGSGPASVLPGKPPVIVLGGANPGTTIDQASTSDFACIYSVTSGFAGATILFDNYGTPETNEYQDLSAFSTLVFGITGSPERIGFEIEDIFTNRVTATFLSTQSGAYQYYSVGKNDLLDKGLHMDRVRFINFVVDSNKAGAANMTGSFGIRSAGLYFPFNRAPDATGAVSRMPVNTEQGAAPGVIVIGGGNQETTVQRPDLNTIAVGYNVTTGGYCGGTILFDNYGTPATNESANFSAFTAIVFRIKGDAGSVNFEVEDADGNRCAGTFTGVTTSWQYFSIPTSRLTLEGVDLGKIRFINFVVDQNAAGVGHYTGTIYVEVLGLSYEIVSGGSETGPATVMPNEPQVITVGGANPGTVVINTNDTLIEVQYDVTTGFAGATILYDDYGTVPVESQDLSGYANLVFGFRGAPDRVKVEFMDAAGRVMVGVATGVSNSPVRYYTFATAEFTNDVTHIAAINFILDAGLAGTGNEQGSLFVVSGGLKTSYTIPPSATGNVTTLPTNAPNVVAIGGGNKEQVVDQYSSTRFRVTYNVTTGGFCGGTILYDDYGTGPLESGDFSALTQVMFKVYGTPGTLNFECEDTSGVKVVGTLLSLQTNSQYYGIRTADLVARGLDLGHVRFMSFVVDSNRAGVANLSGWFEVESAGLNFPNYVYLSPDSDGDGLPDDWEDQYDLSSSSGSGDDGANGDPDHDGVNNDGERVAGTSPIDPDSVPELRIARVGQDVSLWVTGVNQRLYQFQHKESLQSGGWVNIGNARRLWADTALAMTQVVENLRMGFYRCRIQQELSSPMPAKPAVILIGGGNENTVLTQTSSRDFSVSYDVGTGYAGATILFDDYGTGPIESQDLSGFSGLMFGVSGNAESIGYEVEDAEGHKVAGSFRHVSGTMRRYTIPSSLLTAGGVNLTQVRFINFVVDAQKVGAGGTTGSFSIQSFGLGYTMQLTGVASADVTVLPTNAPVCDNLGGANHTENWIVTGTTNVLVNYGVTAGGYDGLSIRYDDYVTPEFESGNFSALTSVIFGIEGTPKSVKVEFTDVSTNTAIAVLNGVTNAGYRYYSVPLSDVDDIGVDVSRIRFINFVVDQQLAGAANLTGTFSVATGNLAP